ncbi:MAG TPA: hypothetical protein VEZ90_01900 [Blastocatellia bacterium]|nr:hypothetical protein [Blastocatellia bacterium]
MTLIRLLLIVASIVSTESCLALGRVPAKNPLPLTEDGATLSGFNFHFGVPVQAKSNQQPYPGVIADSSERQASAERDWRRMLDAYGVPAVRADLYPITYAPKSIPAGAQAMKITPPRSSESEDVTSLRETVKIFLERWRDLFLADPDATSLVSASHDGNTTVLSFRQTNYPYPIAGEFGTFSLSVTQDGKLEQIDDRFIPLVDVPQRPVLERSATAERVVGRTFSINDAPGEPVQVSATDKKQVTVRQLVVLPLKKDKNIEVHLAWEVDVTAGRGCTVYVDAITGESLAVTPPKEAGRAGKSVAGLRNHPGP